MRLGSALLPIALAAAALALAVEAFRRPTTDAVAGAERGIGGSADGAAGEGGAPSEAPLQPADAPDVFPGWVGAGDGETAGAEEAFVQPTASTPTAPPAESPTPSTETSLLAVVLDGATPAPGAATPATAPPPAAAPPSPLVANLRVRVAEPDGTPVAGAWIQLRGPDGAARTERADGAGELRVLDLAPGAWDVGLLSPGLRQGPVAFELHDASASASASPGPGETRELALVAPPRARLAGRATLAGRPLAGAEIAVVDLVAPAPADDGLSNAVRVRCVTANDGSFRAPPVPPGRYRFEMRHADLGASPALDGAAGHVRELDLAEGPARLDLELEPAELAGRVFGPDGAPLRGAVLWLEGAGYARLVARDGEGFFGLDGATPERLAVEGGAWAASDGDGFYLLDGILPADGLRLVVEAPGAAPIEWPLALTPGTTRRLDVRCEPGAALDVVLVDQGGAPVAGAWLVARAADGRERWARTDAHGVARWPSLTPGEVRVAVDGVERALEVAAAERTELVLARP